MSALSAVTQTVSDIAGDVVDTAKSAVTDSAQQIAKTPLDILEDLLGTSSSSDTGNQSAEEKASGQNQAAIQQKTLQDDSFKQQQHQSLHQQIMQESQGYYEQKKQMDAQQKQMEQQQKEQEKFQIRQLEKQKKENLQVQMAKDASNAEKRVGAG